MSYTELHTGKAKEVAADIKGLKPKLVSINFPIETLEDYELEDGYLDSEEYIYIKSKDKLFKLINHKNTEPDDYLLEGSKSKSGKINFTLMFYNGGTCLEEMFEDLLDKLEKE